MNLRNIVSNFRIFLVVVWLTSFGYWIVVTGYLLKAPLHPDATTGHIIPWSNHGEIHFGTVSLVRSYDVSFFLFVSTLVFIFGCTALEKFIISRHD